MDGRPFSFGLQRLAGASAPHMPENGIPGRPHPVSSGKLVAATQHNHIVNIDLGYVSLFTSICLVGAMHEFSVDGHLLTLFEVLACNFRKFSPDDDLMPLRVFHLFAALILVGVGGGEGK